MPRAVSTSVRGGQCPWSVPAGLVVALVVRAAGRLALPLCRAPLLRRGHGDGVWCYRVVVLTGRVSAHTAEGERPAGCCPKKCQAKTGMAPTGMLRPLCATVAELCRVRNE